MGASKNKNTATPVLKTGDLARPDLFILSPWQDRTFFIFTPFIAVLVLLLGMIAGLTEQAAFAAATIGAAGHHLPGMLRAYGDKDLFKKFRLRFIAAPIILTLVCATAMYFRVAAVNVVMLIWGFWHGLAQLYGFARIYDRKAGCTATNGRLDLALLVLWFGTGIINSDNRMAEILSLTIDSGFPEITAVQLSTAALIWTACAIGFTCLYIFRQFKGYRLGQPFSVNKLLMLTVSLAFWNLVMITVPVTIVSIALFELFHDAQYMGIVWSFNRNREQKQMLTSRFEKNMFGNGFFGLGFYLLAILIYGSFAMVQYRYPSAPIRDAAIVFFTVSTLLHFYFDGFIWKLRDPAIGRSLHLKPESITSTQKDPAFRHAIKWAALFALLVGISFLQRVDERNLIEKKSAILAAVPAHFQTRVELTEALKEMARTAEAAGQNDAAIVWYKQAIATLPSDRETQSALLRLSTDTSFNFLD